MKTPNPAPIFRIVHVENLPTLLARGGLHAPNHTPDDDLPFRVIHNPDIQAQRRISGIPCGPRGVIHDYVAFYLGPRSPMLFQLHTGWVTGYAEGQEPLVYLVSTAQSVHDSRTQFVSFSAAPSRGSADFTVVPHRERSIRQGDELSCHGHHLPKPRRD